MTTNEKSEVIDKRVAGARRVLGNPVALIFDDNALRVRRNLLIFSALTVFISFTGISVNPDSSISGIHFDGLTQKNVLWALLVVNAYHFAHFVWFVYEGFIEWTLRLTGMKAVRSSGWGNKSWDVVEDPRQSTLYNWWLSQTSQLYRGIDALKQSRIRVDEINNELSRPGKALATAPFEERFKQLSEQVENVQKAFHGLSIVINDERIIESLKSFDGWFIHFQSSQNYRWLIIECVLPLILSVYALYWLIVNIFYFKCINNICI